MNSLEHQVPAGLNCDRLFKQVAWGVVLLALGLLLFARGLTRRDEGRYAEVAREMLQPGGDGWEMRLMGVRYYEKPPMLYWLSAASMKLLGRTDDAARLPLLGCLLLTLGLCFIWAQREWDGPSAEWGAALLATSIGFGVSMCLLLTDAPLTLFMTATALFTYSAFRVDATRRWLWLLLAALAAWGGVLTKGFIAIVLPAGTLFFWLLWERRLRDLWQWALLPALGVLIGLLAMCLWHIEQHNPGFNYRFIIEEHLQRFAGTRAIQGHPEPIWFYFPALLILAAPWSLFIPRAIRNLQLAGGLHRDAFSRFLMTWVAVIFIFFTASRGKLISYMLPLMPPLLLLLARHGMAPQPVSNSTADRRLWTLGAMLPMVAPLGVAIFWTVTRLGISTDFGPPTWISALPIATALIVTGALIFKRNTPNAATLFLIASLTLGAFASLTSPLAGDNFRVGFSDHRPFFKKIARLCEPPAKIVLCRKYLPALAFYLDEVPWFYGITDELAPGMAQEPDRRGIFSSASQLYAAIEAHPQHTFYAVLLKRNRDLLSQQGLRFKPTPLAEDLELVMLELENP